MQTAKYPEKGLEWTSIMERPIWNRQELSLQVQPIINEVFNKGDEAVFHYTALFDGVELEDLNVYEDEVELAIQQVSQALRDAIKSAYDNIYKFHASQQEEIKKIETVTGVECWRKSVPIESVGIYIPGGSAPLFSTVLMLAIPAQIAGCRQVILCSPPNENGEIHPAILYAAELCGVHEIYKVGGAQAIAAMAYGTESIPKVHKIFGPGNQYVTIAKQLVNVSGTAIDIPAGPSEVLIIGDDEARPDFIAADLLAQAEHGEDSQVIFVTTSEAHLNMVHFELDKQLEQLPRKNIAEKALKNSWMVLLNDLDDAIAFSNQYAPEHLILQTRDAEDLAEKVINAGSVFIGHYSPESAGDYASGTNHTLPTNGYAAAFSGVSLDSFMKKITFQKISKKGLENLANSIEIMAAAEGLDAHKNSVSIRISNDEG